MYVVISWSLRKHMLHFNYHHSIQKLYVSFWKGFQSKERESAKF